MAAPTYLIFPLADTTIIHFPLKTALRKKHSAVSYDVQRMS